MKNIVLQSLIKNSKLMGMSLAEIKDLVSSELTVDRIEHVVIAALAGCVAGMYYCLDEAKELEDWIGELRDRDIIDNIYQAWNFE